MNYRKPLSGILLGLLLGISVPAYAEGEVQLKVNVFKKSGFSEVDSEKLAQAIQVLEQVINSDELKQAIIDHTYNGEQTFANNDGQTNEQIYEALVAAKETYTDVADNEMDFDLALYTPPWYKKWSVVGYTYPNTSRIYMNRYYFRSFEPNEIAGNMAHEWMHKIGYGHDYKRTARRPYSVPYAVGDLVVEIGKKFL